MAARDGLANFGAYVGTWQANHQRLPSVPGAYVLGGAQGRIEIMCSPRGFVISEVIFPRNQTVGGLALRLGLSEIPDDARKIYDHVHPGCRTLQYASAELARQLGSDDPDGHVDFLLQSDTPVYNPASVTTIRLDVTDVLGGDSRAC